MPISPQWSSDTQGFFAHPRLHNPDSDGDKFPKRPLWVLGAFWAKDFGGKGGVLTTPSP